MRCKKEVKVDAEIPVDWGCRIVIHRIFGGVIPLIQRASLEKIPMDWNPPKHICKSFRAS
jgi:hypothetical protein